MEKPVIGVFYDPAGMSGGKHGCWRARVNSKPGFHAAGRSGREAIDDLLVTLQSFGEPCTQDDYQIEAK